MAKYKKLNIFRCLFIGLLLVFLAEMVKQEMRIHRLDSEITAAKARIGNLLRQQEQLKAEQAESDDPKYIEKIAREQYNMVKKEELPVFVKE